MVFDDAVMRVLDRLYRADAAERDAGLPSARRTRNLSAESGRLLAILAAAMGATSILEIGSSNGVSTIWLATAMRATGGFVTGTELIAERAAEADASIAEAGLAAFAKVVPGDARATMATLDGPFDLIFIDAEKDDYVAHADAALPLLRPFGLIVADNVTSHDLGGYQRMMRGRDDVESITLPFERGFELTLKTAG